MTNKANINAWVVGGLMLAIATTKLALAGGSFQTVTMQVPEPDNSALQAIVDEV